MSAHTGQRKLAAIMFTDMVGYSALSQRNGALASELLEEHRRGARDSLASCGSDIESATFANVKVTAPDGRVLFNDDFRSGLDQWINATNTTLRYAPAN